MWADLEKLHMRVLMITSCCNYIVIYPLLDCLLIAYPRVSEIPLLLELWKRSLTTSSFARVPKESAFHHNLTKHHWLIMIAQTIGPARYCICYGRATLSP